MQDFRVQRTGDRDLVFSGVLLADLSSRDHAGQTRWTEIRVYRTDAGKYVTEQIGRSTVRGEIDRRDVKVVDAATEVHVALRRRADNPYLTNLALDALAEAGQHDEAIAAALDERI